MVHPDHFRKGIATSLLKALEESEAAIRAMVVCTGADNTPAIQLYQRFGFKKVRNVTLPDGLVLCELCKEFHQESRS
jgi:ribosomal protein S18 acetylase RimI-like enzyme